ncbi:MAG TPA: sigma-70 family RNA polymerase sigma factor [Armatimonadota bacterium]|jgi:RNA polymerase sigma-70 factor (ECF subfamily)
MAEARPDRDLVRLAQSGDAEAFEELFQRYHKAIYNIVYRLLGNPEDASDLTQDAFVNAFRALKSLRDPGIFYPWVRQIAVNLSRNQHKRATRVRVHSLDDTTRTEEGEQLSRELPDWSPGPSEELEDRELQERIAEAIATLSPDHRAVVTLHHLEDVPVAEVADMLGISVGTVKSRLARARDRLARRLRGYVEPEEVTK